MNIIAYAASNSTKSINRRLVEAAAQVFQDEAGGKADVEILDLNDYEMPIYSMDREADGGVPARAKAFYGKIGAADGIIVSYAEHNGTYAAAYKNIFDWMSRIDAKVFQGKPMLAMSASPGKNGGANVLRQATESAPHFGAEISASLSVPHFGDNFDWEAGRLTNDELRASLLEAVTVFRGAINGIVK